MEISYAAQTQIIAILHEKGDIDLADPSRTLYDRSPTAIVQQRLAIFLSIVRVHFLPPRDDQRMVVGHSILGRCGEHSDACHYPNTWGHGFA